MISFFFLNTVLLLIVSCPVESNELNELGNPNDGDDRIIVLDGEGELFDGTTYFDVPLGQGSVSHAQLNVTVLPYNNSYPLNPTINVGMDTDIEWEYSGLGYGWMGYQNYFNDGATKHTISFTNSGGGTDYSTISLIPKGAHVNSADISMKGRFSQPKFSKFNYSSDRGLEGARAIELGDIDGDNWLDAVVTSQTMDKLVWYRNDGTPRDSEWDRTEISTTLTRAWALAIADMDNDGDIDVVATSNNQVTKYGVFWYENVNTTDNLQPGNGSFWTPHRIDSSSTSFYIHKPESVRIADLDNDGDNDTIVGSNDNSKGGVYWFENVDGKATAWNNYTIYHQSSSNGAVRDIDVNNINHTASSRKDVVATLYNNQYVVWFENDGDPVNTNGNWKRHNIYNRQYPDSVAIGDINADGKNDVVVGYEQSYGVYWYKAPSDVTTTSSWTSDNRVGWIWYVADVEIAKINSDNHMDVVATSYDWDYIYYFRNNNGIGTSFSSYSIEWNFDGPMGIAVANIDKDGNGRDIAINGFNSAEVRWYRNGGGAYPNWETCTIEEVSLNGPQSIYSVDIDRDGDNDTFVLGNRGGDIIWFEAPANPKDMAQNWTSHVIDNYLNDAWELFAGDINGDGWIDVAVSGQMGNTIVWYECPQNPETVFSEWNKTVVDPYLYNAWGVHIADIDDDGDNDIVATGRYADYLVWYRNDDGNGTAWSRFFIDNNINYPTGIWVEDMDGDSDLDVVVVSYYWSSGTGVRWYEAPDDPTATWTQHTIDTQPRYVYDVQVADIDHDGNPDVVIAPNYDRYLRWYEAPDDPKNGTWLGHDIWSSSNYYLYGFNLWVDDIGNDGYYDIVVGRNYEWLGINQVLWFEAPDQPELDMQWSRYTVDSYISSPMGVFIADIDDDQIQDVLATSYSKNLVNWYSVDISYPRDVTLSIGPTEIFKVNGELNINLKHSTDFTGAVNDFLRVNQNNTVKDDYGNELIEVQIATSTIVEGRVTLEDIDIVYDHTATVTVNPVGDLAWEITDLVPKGEKNGTHRIYIGFSSQEACKVKFSDLLLIYNGAPELSKQIPNKAIDEDTFVEELYYLPEYFKDDYQTPEQLYYELVDWTNKEYVDMKIRGDSLNVSCLKTPYSNWYGTSEVMVAAYDYEGIRTESNMFNVTIEPVNDIPYVSAKIPDIKMLVNTTNTQLDLARVKKPFFKDIENDKLYYGVKVAKEFKDNISLNLTTENILEITSIGGPAKNITVTVYCDDNPFSPSDFNTITTYQQFEIEVVEVIDEEALKIPRWSELPDCVLEEDHPGLNNWIFLPNYVKDYDDNTKTLIYSIVTITNNGYLEMAIDSENYIDITPLANFDGESEVVLKATDDEGHYGFGRFKIKMIPEDDPPVIEYLEPSAGAVVSGKVVIQGTGIDIEGADVSIQLKLGLEATDEPWLDLANTEGYWSYLFDTSEYTTRTELTLAARGFDGKLYSENETLDIVIDNTLKDSDGDGWADGEDNFPYDPLEWIDSDYDGVGDNEDAFDRDPTQWSDQDGDGYGDNPQGKGYDAFPLDMTQHRDKDGDGYGDNPEGNKPDYDPDDPKVRTKDDLESEDEGLLADIQNRVGPLLPVWIIVIILIIIDVYVITYLYLSRSGKLAEWRAAKEARAAAQQEQEAQRKAEDKDKAEGKEETGKDEEGVGPGRTGAMVRPIVLYPDRMGTVGAGPGAAIPPIPGLTIPAMHTQPQPQAPVYPYPPRQYKEMDKIKPGYGVYRGKPSQAPTQAMGPPYFPLINGYRPAAGKPKPTPGPGTAHQGRPRLPPAQTTPVPDDEPKQ